MKEVIYKEMFMENFYKMNIKKVTKGFYGFKKVHKEKEKKKNIKKNQKKYSRKKAREIKGKIYICESCGREDRNIEIHHIDHNALNNDIKNLIGLCDICHYEVHKDEPIGRIMYKRIMNQKNRLS